MCTYHPTFHMGIKSHIDTKAHIFRHNIKSRTSSPSSTPAGWSSGFAENEKYISVTRPLHQIHIWDKITVSDTLLSQDQSASDRLLRQDHSASDIFLRQDQCIRNTLYPGILHHRQHLLVWVQDWSEIWNTLLKQDQCLRYTFGTRPICIKHTFETRLLCIRQTWGTSYSSDICLRKDKASNTLWRQDYSSDTLLRQDHCIIHIFETRPWHQTSDGR